MYHGRAGGRKWTKRSKLKQRVEQGLSEAKMNCGQSHKSHKAAMGCRAVCAGVWMQPRSLRGDYRKTRDQLEGIG